MPKASDHKGPVLITGCSSGVGYATALAFRAAGFETFATARDAAQMDGLRVAGCHILALDVIDEAARRAVVDAIEKQFGSVGILVNNAGYGQYGPLEEISLDDMRRQFETNVFGGLRLSQLVLPAMRRAGGGRIINVSSVAGRASALGGGAYHASKFAMEALTDALRPEVEPFGVDVVNVLPGPISTCFEATLLKSIPNTGGQRGILRDIAIGGGSPDHLRRGGDKRAEILLAVARGELSGFQPGRTHMSSTSSARSAAKCLDHIVIFNEHRLHEVLSKHFEYHHKVRMHLSLNKDCPQPRHIQPPSDGKIIVFPEVGRLHHRYERPAK